MMLYGNHAHGARLSLPDPSQHPLILSAAVAVASSLITLGLIRDGDLLELRGILGAHPAPKPIQLVEPAISDD
jgi:hypothetical protein